MIKTNRSYYYYITSNGVGESEAVEKCWYTAQLVRLCVCGDDSCISVIDSSAVLRCCRRLVHFFGVFYKY